MPRGTHATGYIAAVAGAAAHTRSGEQQLAVCAAVLLIVFHANAIEALANGADRFISSQDTLARGSDSVLQTGGTAQCVCKRAYTSQLEACIQPGCWIKAQHFTSTAEASATYSSSNQFFSKLGHYYTTEMWWKRSRNMQQRRWQAEHRRNMQQRK